MKRKGSLTLLSLFALLLSGCNLLPTPKKGGEGPNGGSSTSGATSESSQEEGTEDEVITPEEGVIPGDEPEIPLDEDTKAYYSTLDDSKTGSALLNELNSLNKSKRKKTIGYNNFKTMFQYTEVDPKGTTPSGKMYGFYDNALVSATWDNVTWNREHVWPESRGGGKVDADILMTRPTSVKINSDRGNNVYGLVSGSYDPGQFIPEYRGVAARIILYCAIADTSLNLNESTVFSDNTMGILSQLLKWNLDYLPGGKDSESLALRIEWNRNEVNQKRDDMQGNRNPFVDHPEYACRIWGTKSSETKAACGIS